MERKPIKLSISKRITFMYTGFLLGTLIIFNFLMQGAISYISIFDVRNELVSDIDTVVAYIKSTNGDSYKAFNNLQLGYNTFLNVFDENKNLVYTSKNDLPQLEIYNDNKPRLYYEKQKHGIALTYISRKVVINDKIFYIQLERSTESFKVYFMVFVRAFSLTCILGIFMFIFSGRYFSKRILKPIRKISETAKEITSNSLNKRIPIDGPDDEIKELSQIFNSMIENLETDFERQKRFISDVSHELRTPLAVIHGNVNMLNRWGKNDPEILSNSLVTLEAETNSMNKLIEKLLFLAKNDSNSFVLNCEEFNLYTLLKEVVDEATLIQADYSVEFLCAKEHRIYADYNSIKQVLRNLLDNSMKYSLANFNIIVRAEKCPEGTVITVSDHGIGIPPESLPHIFDRFYRVDESRTKSTGGSGLGLSIVKQIVQSHNGTISVSSNLGEGTEFKIFIPDEGEKILR